MRLAAQPGKVAAKPVVHAFDGGVEHPLVSQQRVEARQNEIVLNRVEGESLTTTLQQLLVPKGIQALFYVGFATNLCIIEKPYGIEAMSKEGFTTILMRDCTAALEYPDTVKDEWGKAVATDRIMYLYGFSCLSTDFIGGFN